MTDYCVQMVKSPNLTDAECRARLARVYRLLAEIGQKARVADQESFESETLSAARDESARDGTHGAG